MPDKSVKKPFAGIRILDFTRYVAGPFGTYQLALLGADVIKIEPKAGDDMRHSQLSREWAAKGLGPSFLGINSNKRSLTLDLTKPQAVEIVKRLAEGADVVWENFRPGVMDRFGIGYEALRGLNPKLIYCAVSGFGQNGPERGTAAFDGKLQAMSGIMSITGHEDKGPTRAGFALCDTIGGMTAAFAVASALFQRTPYRRGAVRRCRDARRGAGVHRAADRRIHGDRPQAPPVRQSVLDRQGHRQPLQGRRRRSDARRDDREAVFQPDDRRSADPTRCPIRVSRTGRAAAATSRPCAPSSRRRSPPTARATGKSG